MTQSSSLHAAIIMDGNGRWAERRGLPRTAGHRAGAKAVERIVEAAPAAGISTLTLYAFSSDNWSRPMPEVAALMRLFRSYLKGRRARAVENGVAVEVIGRRDRLPVSVLREIAETEAATRDGALLRLRIAVDYSARDAILRAALRAAEIPDLDRERFARLLAEVDHGRPDVPPVDLLIRTGGEQRLSDFQLWELAYAELFFAEAMWPDFDRADLEQCVARFLSRERRFGGLAGRSHLTLSR
ncbi:MAG TPA: di-trans,poly-cis-decaprenylcistransferase [Gemmatimonadales bacterium]|nr:di-trans,poly-cis-decaprenylcistransferase [Gemmatimonadales bacterium]